jgi:hypothetical protein
MVECVSFSVIPALTALWAPLILAALPGRGARVLVGDCGGGLPQPPGTEGRLRIVGIANDPHGAKLDRFVRFLCRGDYLIVCDDDVFWLDGSPWRWSLEHLRRNPATAVVSLCPRDPLPAETARRLGSAAGLRPMGSFCLVLRRKLWLREGLSFRGIAAEDNPYGLVFDTADLAHLMLLQRGFEVAIAPEPVRERLVVFERTSSWILRIQQTGGEVAAMVGDRPSRQEKSLRAVILARCISQAAREHFPDLGLLDPAPAAALDRAQAICGSLLGPARARAIEEEGRAAFSRVERRLAEIAEIAEIGR